MEKVLDMTINLTKVSGIFTTFKYIALICRFNGFWPKLQDLNQYFFTILTNNYDIYLCSEGFFVVEFDTEKDLEFALNEGS